NDALGPINGADGGSNLPIVLPPTSSNFTITVEDLTQRASATTRTVKVTPHIELDHSVGELEKAFNQTDSTTYHARITHSIYDSLGIKHLLELYFIKASNSTPPQWQMIAKVNGKDIGDPAPGNSTTSDTATVARYNLQFDQNGQVDTAQSDPGLVSNWHPLLESGEPTGADLPVNKIDGATLPIPEPPDSSNFEIDYSSLKLNFKQR
ncbi:MAG: hypothetical protein MI864_07920, partial [Pseudomonadales bacterium]|nr:hypothetical protein [Pseudomonadales bacterium]